MIKYLLLVITIGFIGCGDNDMPEPMHSPVCDRTTTFFVARCGLSETAQCKLYTNAPSGSMNTGCSVVVLSSTTGEASYLECVDKCD